MSSQQPDRAVMGEATASIIARPSRRRKRFGTSISRAQYLSITVAVFLGLLAVWWLITGTGLVSKLFLPSPVDVLNALMRQADNGQLWTDIGASIYRIGVGYLIATAMAIPLGVLAGVSPRWEAAIEPLMDFIRYMPVVAFVPLTIVWVGTDDSQKFLIIWLGTFFQQVLLISDAVRQIDPALVDLGETLGYGRYRILRSIVVPAAMPRIWDALRVTLGWAWTWLVVAELVAATSGLGYRINTAQRFFATDIMIAYVILLGVLGLCFDQIMRAIGRAMFRYQKGRK